MLVIRALILIWNLHKLKQEQLLTFSKTISNLQQKARDTRYKERLDKMESKTMSMLISTGLGVMIFLVFAVMHMMGA